LFECGNFQKLRPRGYNKIQEPPNTWFRGQTRCGLSLLNIETKFACCRLVSLSMQGFLSSGPFAWALARVMPNASGFTPGAPSFPLHILHHAGSFIGLNYIRRSTRYVASCELPGLPGQQRGKISLGTMLIS